MRRPIVVTIVLAAVALVAGLVVTLARAPAEVEPGTPQAAVQQFSEAVLDGDLGTALSLVAEPRPRRLTCTPRPGLRIVLVDVTEAGDTARVDVRVTEHPDGGGFPGQGYTFDDVFQLERTAGTWYLVSWPWALCAPVDAVR